MQICASDELPYHLMCAEKDKTQTQTNQIDSTKNENKKKNLDLSTASSNVTIIPLTKAEVKPLTMCQLTDTLFSIRI